MGLIAAGAVGGFAVGVAAVIPFSSETAREKVIETLAARFDADVALVDLKIRLLPQFHAEGHGLSIRYRGRRDVPPMISIERFSAEGNLLRLLHRHISRVVVDRLDIEIPPDHNADSAQASSAPSVSERRLDPRDIARTFIIDELTSNDSKLAIIPGEPSQATKVWIIHNLRMESISIDKPMPFAAVLDNAIPPGAIATSGSFGPWGREYPGKTPLEGAFTFERADLGVFKGISGILSAHGTFGGTLNRIDIHGETDTPDFTVASGGHPMPLHAVYHAVVDGTNGNTLLDRVDASFLRTSLVAKGGVVGKPGVAGRTVTLDVVMDKARLEDVLRMAIKAQPSPMTGALKLRTKLVIPPGDRDVVQKLLLDGTFAISDARFTTPVVQTRIDELSHRTQGRAPVEKPEQVSSQFAGAFKLANGRLDIPRVTFNVPGSTVRLSGTYGLVSERIDFAGTVLTDAKISQMTSGIKSLLLKPLDLLFNKNGGGSAIPIRITGTRSAPSFGLDRGRLFKRQ